MGLIIITVAVLLIFTIDHVLPFVLGGGGGFYVVNEFMNPRKFENEFIKYDTCFEPDKDNYLDKRMYGILVVKKKLEKIGAKGYTLKESNNDWLNANVEKNFDTLCDPSFPQMYFFQKSFTAIKTMDRVTCTLDKGTYYIRNYSIEDDFKNRSNIMTYGHYRLILIILADVGGKRREITTTSWQLWSKDEKNKKYEQIPKNSKKWPKCDKYD